MNHSTRKTLKGEEGGLPDETQAKKVRSVLPWQKGAAWWVVLLEGIFLTGLGLYMFFARSPTYILLGWVIALSLGISGGLRVYLAYQMKGDGEGAAVDADPWRHRADRCDPGGVHPVLGGLPAEPGIDNPGLGLPGIRGGGVNIMLLSKSSYNLRRVS